MPYLLIDFIGGVNFEFSHISDVRDFVINSWQELLEDEAIFSDCSCQEFYEENYTLYHQVEDFTF